MTLCEISELVEVKDSLLLNVEIIERRFEINPYNFEKSVERSITEDMRGIRLKIWIYFILVLRYIVLSISCLIEQPTLLGAWKNRTSAELFDFSKS